MKLFKTMLLSTVVCLAPGLQAMQGGKVAALKTQLTSSIPMTTPGQQPMTKKETIGSATNNSNTQSKFTHAKRAKMANKRTTGKGDLQPFTSPYSIEGVTNAQSAEERIQIDDKHSEATRKQAEETQTIPKQQTPATTNVTPSEPVQAPQQVTQNPNAIGTLPTATTPQPQSWFQKNKRTIFGCAVAAVVIVGGYLLWGGKSSVKVSRS